MPIKKKIPKKAKKTVEATGESRKELDTGIFCSNEAVNGMTRMVKDFFAGVKTGKKKFATGAKARVAFRNEFKDALRELTSRG